MKRTPSRARSRSAAAALDQRDLALRARPAGIATRSPTFTSRVTRATTWSSTRARSLVTAVSISRPITESAGDDQFFELAPEVDGSRRLAVALGNRWGRTVASDLFACRRWAPPGVRQPRLGRGVGRAARAGCGHAARAAGWRGRRAAARPSVQAAFRQHASDCSTGPGRSAGSLDRRGRSGRCPGDQERPPAPAVTQIAARSPSPPC